MELQALKWQVGYTKNADEAPVEFYPAQVPGAVQADYARAKSLDPVVYGNNFKEYAWMEDMYWLYRAELNFTLAAAQTATLVFKGIDYRYRILVDETVLTEGEGLFTPVELDVSAYAGAAHTVQVLLFPVPKDPTGSVGTRDEARRSCKPAACYGWDWHPRLVSSGIWDEAGLWIRHKKHIDALDVSYELSPALDRCRIDVTAQVSEACHTVTRLLDGEQVVAEGIGTALSLTVENPKLWYPTGYGEQHLYTLETTLWEDGKVLDQRTRKLGLRRSRMVMNEGSWRMPNKFPKSRSDAPATLEINGRRIFAKGSNWVNMDLYPGESTQDKYEALLKLVKDANMNILRIWGGGYVNKDSFFALCDELGIMVWQEFPLACNEYPDADEYLQVLEKEATSIVRRLRSHPCLVMWCGGNELFNNWSGMTEQHHALRLLDKICYTEDRFTPFLMTSPLNGMAHGHYVNYDERAKEEFISLLVNAQNTAYTEFGAPGAADPDYIREYCSAQDYADCNGSNPVWKEHHAFSAWTGAAWLRTPEVEYYFGGYQDTDDLCHKTRFIQSMCYRSFFEEMRKQWPHCSMALNWCFNEPWPCFANNSLVCWPTQVKPAYYAVQAALRPQLASLRIDRHLWYTKEAFNAQVWVLNDSIRDLEPLTVEIRYQLGDQPAVFWGSLQVKALQAQKNIQCGSISFDLDIAEACTFKVMLCVKDHPEMDSEYTYLCRPKVVINTKGILNL